MVFVQINQSEMSSAAARTGAGKIPFIRAGKQGEGAAVIFLLLPRTLSRFAF